MLTKRQVSTRGHVAHKAVGYIALLALACGPIALATAGATAALTTQAPDVAVQPSQSDSYGRDWAAAYAVDHVSQWLVEPRRDSSVQFTIHDVTAVHSAPAKSVGVWTVIVMALTTTSTTEGGDEVPSAHGDDDKPSLPQTTREYYALAVTNLHGEPKAVGMPQPMAPALVSAPEDVDGVRVTDEAIRDTAEGFARAYLGLESNIDRWVAPDRVVAPAPLAGVTSLRVKDIAAYAEVLPSTTTVDVITTVEASYAGRMKRTLQISTRLERRGDRWEVQRIVNSANWIKE